MSLLYLIVSIAFVTSTYTSLEVSLMRDMRKYHHYEFNVHYRKTLTLFIATLLSLVSIFVFEVIVFYTLACSERGLFIENNNLKDAFFDGNGFCKVYIENYSKYFSVT